LNLAGFFNYQAYLHVQRGRIGVIPLATLLFTLARLLPFMLQEPEFVVATGHILDGGHFLKEFPKTLCLKPVERFLLELD
jgi:hypothetical protein